MEFVCHSFLMRWGCQYLLLQLFPSHGNLQTSPSCLCSISSKCPLKADEGLLCLAQDRDVGPLGSAWCPWEQLLEILKSFSSLCSTWRLFFCFSLYTKPCYFGEDIECNLHLIFGVSPASSLDQYLIPSGAMSGLVLINTRCSHFAGLMESVEFTCKLTVLH